MNTEEQETIAQIRDTVFKVSEEFPGTYWQEKDRERAYPTEFVNRLTELGLLASLIPEEYGGSGLSIIMGAEILKAIHEFGGNAGACHAQMYTMGTVLRHGSNEQKQKYLPKIASFWHQQILIRTIPITVKSMITEFHTISSLLNIY